MKLNGKKNIHDRHSVTTSDPVACRRWRRRKEIIVTVILKRCSIVTKEWCSSTMRIRELKKQIVIWIKDIRLYKSSGQIHWESELSSRHVERYWRIWLHFLYGVECNRSQRRRVIALTLANVENHEISGSLNDPLRIRKTNISMILNKNSSELNCWDRYIRLISGDNK